MQRALPAGFTLEAAYVGRLGQHLLSQLDLAEPVDYVDPQGGGDYYTAGTALSKIANANGDDASATVAPIPYWSSASISISCEHRLYGEKSATQAFYSDEWAPNMEYLGATTALSDVDYGCAFGFGYYNCPAGYQSKFWQPQFVAGLFSLATVGMSLLQRP